MEIKKLIINDATYAITFDQQDEGFLVDVFDVLSDDGTLTLDLCKILHWSSQQIGGPGVLFHDTIVFVWRRKVFKAKIIKQTQYNESSCKVYLIGSCNKNITVRSVNDVILASRSIGKIDYHNKNIPITNPLIAEESIVENSIFNVLRSPLAGLVVKIKVTEGQFVSKNQSLIVIESMKMENDICAPLSAFIKTLSISEGNLVKPNQVIVTFESKKGREDAGTQRSGSKEVFEY